MARESLARAARGQRHVQGSSRAQDVFDNGAGQDNGDAEDGPPVVQLRLGQTELQVSRRLAVWQLSGQLPKSGLAAWKRVSREQALYLALLHGLRDAVVLNATHVHAILPSSPFYADLRLQNTGSRRRYTLIEKVHSFIEEAGIQFSVEVLPSENTLDVLAGQQYGHFLWKGMKMAFHLLAVPGVGDRFLETFGSFGTLQTIMQKLIQQNLSSQVTLIPRLSARFTDFLQTILRSLAGDRDEVATVNSWKKLCLLPLLCTGFHGSTSSTSSRNKLMDHRFDLWAQGHYHLLFELLEETGGEDLPQRSTTQQASTRAMKFLRYGALSRAYQQLQSKVGLAPPTSDTQEALLGLHPPGAGLQHDLAFEDIEAFTAEDVHATLKKVKRLSGPGPSGLRFEHLLTSIHACPDFSILLAKVCTKIARGAVPKSILPLLGGGRLVPFQKPGRGVRPIVLPETFRKLTGKLILRRSAEALCTALSPYQFGVGMKGGLETMTLGIRTTLESTPSCDTLISFDCSNAFNKIKRSSIAAQVIGLPEISNYLKVFYEADKPLISNLDLDLLSSEGVLQGDPLGPALFALGLHPALHAVASRHPDIKVFAYLDDVSLCGPAASVLAASSTLEAQLDNLNLAMNRLKTQAYCTTTRGRAVLATAGFEDTSRGLVVAGVPLGTDDFVCASVTSKVDALLTQIDTLQEFPSHQAKNLLMRFCVLPQTSYITRSISPKFTVPALQGLDRRVQEFCAGMLMIDLPSFDDHHTLSTQVGLPLRAGGVGLPRLATLAPAARLAGFHLGAKNLKLPDTYWDNGTAETLLELRDAHTKHHINCNSSSKLLPLPVAHTPSRTYATTTLTNKALNDEVHQAQSAALDQQAALFRDSRGNPCELVIKRLQSVRKTQSGAFLMAIPTNPRLEMDNTTFSTALSLRLGVKPPLFASGTCANCMGRIDDEGLHPHTCRPVATPLYARRHFIIQRAWSTAFAAAKLSCEEEPADLFKDVAGLATTSTTARPAPVHSLRPDHRIGNFARSGQDLLTDVSMVFPHVRGSVEYRERDKQAKYTRDREGNSILPPQFLFVPLVVDIYGAWGDHAIKTMNTLGQRALDARVCSSKPTWTSMQWAYISVSVQRANTTIVRAYLDAINVRSSRPLEDPADLHRTALGQIQVTPLACC